MIQSLLVVLPLVTTLIHLCDCVQPPELLLLEGSKQSAGIYCPGETAQLKCIFPEGERASEWYINATERAYDVDHLAADLPGHSATTLLNNYTIVSIFKEELYRGNYSCAVNFPGKDILSNSVEVLFEEPDGITATCLSSGNDSITVTVSYTNGCRRETMVTASGLTCEPLFTEAAMTIFKCGVRHLTTSYNITASSNGRIHSITCSTEEDLYRGSLTANDVEHTNLVYILLGVLPLTATGLGVVLGLLLYRYRKRQKGNNQLESKAEKACNSGEALQNSNEANSGGNHSVNRSPFDGEAPKAVLRSDSDESRESINSANPLLAQCQADDRDQDVKYAILDHCGPRPVPAPSPHEKVDYTTIKPEM